MTLIVAWRDPFCLVGDSLAASPMFAARLPLPAEKIRVVRSTDLAVGMAGPGDDFDEIVAGVSADPQTDWTALKLATQEIVSAINAPRAYEPTHVSVVVAGTAGGYRDVFACGPLSGMSEADTAAGRSFAWAGTGGYAASVALEEASQSHPEATGEDLLRMIVCEAVVADPRHSGKPIYRIDLEHGATEPYVWLP
jgi:hypothetical protein